MSRWIGTVGFANRDRTPLKRAALLFDHIATSCVDEIGSTEIVDRLMEWGIAIRVGFRMNVTVVAVADEAASRRKGDPVSLTELETLKFFGGGLLRAQDDDFARTCDFVATDLAADLRRKPAFCDDVVVPLLRLAPAPSKGRTRTPRRKGRPQRASAPVA